MSQGDGAIPPSVAVVEAVARREDTDPVQLEPALNDVIDPDALDALCAHGPTNVSVAFSYFGYTVTVDADGGVSVETRQADATAEVAGPPTLTVSD